jgi:hypothetical protein
MPDFGPWSKSGVLSDRSGLVALGVELIRGQCRPRSLNRPSASAPSAASPSPAGYAAVKAFRTAAGWFLMTIMYARTAGSGLRLPCSHS